MSQGQLKTIFEARRFMFQGRAVFTVVSKRTGSRFTYRMVTLKDRDDRVKHVSVLTGPDVYTTLGVVVDEMLYRHATKTGKIGIDAPSAVAFQWILHVVNKKVGDLPEAVEFWHEGKCCRCGRALTVPSSISTGLGPDCLEAWHKESRHVKTV